MKQHIYDSKPNYTHFLLILCNFLTVIIFIMTKVILHTNNDVKMHVPINYGMLHPYGCILEHP